MTQPPRWLEDPTTDERIKSALVAMSTVMSTVAPTAVSEQRILAGVLHSLPFTADNVSELEPREAEPLPEPALNHPRQEPAESAQDLGQPVVELTRVPPDPVRHLVSVVQTGVATKWLVVLAAGGLALATLRSKPESPTAVTPAIAVSVFTVATESAVPPDVNASPLSASNLADTYAPPSVKAPSSVVAPSSVQAASSAPRVRNANPSSELALLMALRTALGTDPERALVLCAQHRREFRAGRFVEEREAMTVEALALLGRTTQARARWLTFQRRYPASVYAERLEKLLSPSATRSRSTVPSP